MSRTSLISVFSAATLLFVVGIFGGEFSVSGPFSAENENRLTFSPVTAKFVRLCLEPASGAPATPCLDEVELFGPGFPNKNIAAASLGGKATASSCIGAYPVHRTEHLNDGRYGNERSWIADPSDQNPFVCIELPEPTSVEALVFSRDRNGFYADRLPKAVSLEISLDGKEFRKVENIAFASRPSKHFRPDLPKTWANVPLPSPPAPPGSSKGSDRNQASPVVVPLPPQWPRKDERGFENLALSDKANARASSSLEGHAIHRIEHLNDGKLGNDHSWIAAKEPCWAEIDLGDIYHVYHVAFGSDSSGRYSDRGAQKFSILLASEYAADSEDDAWKSVVASSSSPVVRRKEFKFEPQPTRYVRIKIDATGGGTARIDELEIYGRKASISTEEAGPIDPVHATPERAGEMRVDAEKMDEFWRSALVGEEYAWLKAFGRADCDPYLKHHRYPIKKNPQLVPDDVTTLVMTTEKPELDGRLDDAFWSRVSRGTVRVAQPSDFATGALVEYHCSAAISGDDLYVGIKTDRLLSSFLTILRTENRAGVIVVDADGKAVWRLYEKDKTFQDTSLDGVANAEKTEFEFRVPKTLLPDVEKGLMLHLGIGGRFAESSGRPLYHGFGGNHTANHGNPVYFYPGRLAIAFDGFRDGIFRLRLTNHADEALTIPVEADLGLQNQTIAPAASLDVAVAAETGELGPERNLEIPWNEAAPVPFRLHLFQYDPVGRTLRLLEEMIGRVPSGISEEYRRHVAEAEKNLVRLREKAKTVAFGSSEERELFYEARKAKREFFFADPNMHEIESILFEKRHPLHPSHNYSDYYDSTWRPGGGIHTLRVPREKGRFMPEKATLTELFKTTGMCRHPVADFGVSKIYFTNRASFEDYWHIMEMNPDGSGLRQLTEGPFHDLWPCPLPDGDLAMISTRCRQKFLCWEPQASVLHRMDKNGKNIKRLSFANLTEFAPSVARDGRLHWTRSEYLDKGADYGHTLWYIKPDGAGPELTFGNTVILPQGYANGREIPGSNEVSCVMISHFGDLNGPVAILDIDRGRMNPDAIINITPEIPWPGFWARNETFREPFPISTNLFLVSHSPRDLFGLFIIDRFGNREMLYMDETFGSMCPTPLRPRPAPPVLTSTIDPILAEENLGAFTLEDVYIGIDHVVPRGSAKYLRICQEMPHFLEKYENGTYRSSYKPYMEFYASPVDLVSGPYGWTSYVAKGDLGTVEIEKDGSATFLAPANVVLFFELLDENYNEIQRMRSVVQVQPGEVRSCVGCHEDRSMTPTTRRRTLAAQRAPKRLTPSPWGAGAFDYQKVVQPVLDRNCVSCHNTEQPNKADLSGTLDKDFIPNSFRTMIRGGYVHHFHWGYQAGVPTKAEPYTFGTVKSRLWPILKDSNHQNVRLTDEEERAIKCWIDLSCPLWPDYTQRSLRGDPKAHDGTVPSP